MSKVDFVRLDYDRVLSALRRFAAEELAPRPEVREVVLIGSLARGDWSAHSDADIVVVVDRSSEPVVAFRSGEYLPRASLGIPVDVFVYTASEAEAWRPQYRSDVESGITLFRRNERE